MAIDTEKLKNETDIVQVVGHYTTLTKRGHEFIGQCVAHNDSNASMTVSPQKGFVHCFACGFNADVIEFIEEVEGLGFVQACEFLGAKNDWKPSLQLPNAKPLAKHDRITQKPPLGSRPKSLAITIKEGDAWCRARLDWLRADNKVILDYKTTESADPETCIRKIASMGYDMQASFYKRGLVACGGAEDAVFVFLFQEITAPYACCLIGLSNTFIEIADQKVNDAIEIWQDCIKNGKWPSYSDNVHYAEPPNWALSQYMAEMEARANGV